ncbi:dihydropteroate synthase [Candidatus Sumerlaeota bacterium]|nr:dihydropteroate synthase [Candidatus Sumerlaeota bacterium]
MTWIVAAVNVSPESFYAGSVLRTPQIADAVKQAEDDGAAMIDIGAMSTAPYKETRITEAEEAARMAVAIRAARGATRLRLSADTQRAEVARVALDEGADIINDVSALRADNGMAALIAARGAGVILMANDDTTIEEGGRSPINVVRDLLMEAMDRAMAAGIAKERIIIDPGIGFFRERSLPWDEWDWEVLRRVGELRALGVPVMVGASRKSFLGKISRGAVAEDRLAGSLAVAAWCAQEGVDWLRVHDVRESSDVLRVLSRLRS